MIRLNASNAAWQFSRCHQGVFLWAPLDAKTRSETAWRSMIWVLASHFDGWPGVGAMRLLCRLALAWNTLVAQGSSQEWVEKGEAGSHAQQNASAGKNTKPQDRHPTFCPIGYA